LTATFPDGHVETRPVTITAGASTSVDFPPLPVEPPPVAPPAEPPIVPPAKGPTDGDSSSTTRTAAWITLGASAAFAGTAVVLGLGTLSARDAFDASGDTSASQRDQALTLRTWTNVAWVAAGAAAVTGVVLFVLPSGSQRGAGTAEIRALPGGLSVNGHY
jgi:hypothetical protein